MQKIIEKVIESKNFELSDMLKKIDTLWVQGNIDEPTRKSLSDKARNNANVQSSIDILTKLEELDKRLKALEEAGKEEPTESYEEYVPGKWYYTGNKVSFEGKNYECIAPEGVVCVWNPSEYPAYWKEIA
jgi:hypothetical protein